MQITARGAVEKDGQLKAGQRVLEVNGTSLLGATHLIAVRALRNNPMEVSLLVCDGYDPREVVRKKRVQERLSISSNTSATLDSSSLSSEGELPLYSSLSSKCTVYTYILYVSFSGVVFCFVSICSTNFTIAKRRLYTYIVHDDVTFHVRIVTLGTHAQRGLHILYNCFCVCVCVCVCVRVRVRVGVRVRVRVHVHVRVCVLDVHLLSMLSVLLCFWLVWSMSALSGLNVDLPQTFRPPIHVLLMHIQYVEGSFV